MVHPTTILLTGIVLRGTSIQRLPAKGPVYPNRQTKLHIANKKTFEIGTPH